MSAGQFPWGYVVTSEVLFPDHQQLPLSIDHEACNPCNQNTLTHTEANLDGHNEYFFMLLIWAKENYQEKEELERKNLKTELNRPLYRDGGQREVRHSVL